jgi:hypothetical protein
MITPSFSLTATERVLPRLALDFTTASLDPRVTFIRAANTATVVNSAGNIEVVNADVPRFDFNPSTLACRGLLIEETRTNSLRNNTMQGVVAGTPGTVPTNWVVQGNANGLTREIVGAGTENGIDYVDVRYSGTPTSTFGVQINFEGNSQVVAANGQTWTTSAYLKLAAGSLTNLNTIVTTVAGRDSGGNAVSGQQGNGTVAATTASLISQRFSNSFTFSSASVAFVRGGFQFGVTSGLAVDVTWRIGLPQLEQGAFATSVIKTSTTAVTRNADVATMTGTNFSDWYNAGQGGVVVRVRPSTVSGTRPVLQFDDATANEVIALRGETTNPELVIVDGGSPQAQIDAGTISANTAYNLGAAWDTDNCAAAVNGGAAVTDTSATVPTVTQARLGSDGTNYLNGHIQTIRYWPQRIINAEVQAFSK